MLKNPAVKEVPFGFMRFLLRIWPRTGLKAFMLQKPAHWLSRKNCCVPELGLVTVFCPFTIRGAGTLVLQTGEARFVVDCRW
jgi:hypothetical protein